MGKQVRKATVLSTEQITPHLQRIVVGSDEFSDLTNTSAYWQLCKSAYSPKWQS